MKKFYALIAAVAFTSVSMAQVNLGFETWADNAPTGWVSAAANTSIGQLTLTGMPYTQGTTGATEGTSYASVQTVTLSDSPSPQIPNGPFTIPLSQLFLSSTKYGTVTFDAKYSIQGSDIGIFYITGYDANEDVVATGIAQFTGTQATFESETVTLDYLNSNAIVDWEIYITSSASSMFNGVPAAVVGSTLEIDNIELGAAIQTASSVTNVVATDISDNNNGTDLQVTFNVPADEATANNKYYAIAMIPSLNPGMALDPIAMLNAYGKEITPNGNNQTVTFSATDVYLGIDGNNFSTNPIENGVEMRVYIYVVGNAGYENIFTASNNITLTSSNVGINENNMTSFVAYPNPATDVLNINSEETISAVTVMSLDGKIVATSNNNTVEVANLQAGVYVYNVTTVSGKKATNKFVKK